MAWLRRLLNRFLDWLITPLWPETPAAQPQAAPDGETQPEGQADAPEPETPAQEAPMAKPVDGLKLTDLERDYLKSLRPGKTVTADELAALHKKPLSNPHKRVRAVIATLRNKLDPANIEIATYWGEGYRLNRRDRTKLTKIKQDAGGPKNL